MVERPQVKRTSEIEEATNVYVVHPISAALVPLFARWGVSPNAVSVMGMAFGGLAAVAYSQYYLWPFALAGFLFMVGWHVMDGADGQLARLTGQTSEIGKVLDGLCDHVAFTLVYLSLTFVAASELGWWVWLVAVAAGLSHLVQASAYEFQRQAYDFWGHAKQSARIERPEAVQHGLRGKAGAPLLFGKLYLAYLRVQYRIAGIDAALIGEMERALGESGEREAEVRAAYRATNLDAVRRWSLLCSNYRTIAIFVAALLGSPLYFFLFEIVGLNAAFVGLSAMQARRNRVLRDWLDETEPSLSIPQPMLSNPV